MLGRLQIVNDDLSSLDYTWGLYGELSPVFLNYVGALTGFSPRPLDGGFAYCDLGCGNGVTLAALATMFPDAEFVGVDAAESHVANGTELAQEAGLSNLRFIHATFADLDDHQLPDFDFAVAHGVYAWIDPDSREAVRLFLGKRLKERGVAYVSYNAMPGWSALLPLREAMLQHTRAMEADPLTRAQAGLDYLAFLERSGAGYFADNPPARAFLAEIQSQDPAYVAHEFFAASVRPCYFHQVAAEMRSAGLHFAGSAQLNLNFIDVAVPADFHDFLRDARSRNEFEQRGDFIRNQRFRKDVYVRGEPDLDEAGQADALAGIPFGLVCHADDFETTARFGEVELNYVSEAFGGLVAAMATGAKTVDEMAGMDGLKGYGRDLLTDAVKFLAAGGQVAPFAHATTAPDARALAAERFAFPAAVDVALLKRRLFQSPVVGLAGPAAGLALEVSMADALYALCSAEATRDEVASWVFQRMLEARQQIVTEDGDETGAIARALEDFRAKRLPKFLELGILAPA